MLRALARLVVKSKIWMVRILAIGLTVFAALSGIGYISEGVIKPIHYIPAAFFMLWLMFEIQLSTGERELPRELLAPPLLPWHEALPEILNAIGRADKTICLVGSSSESMYVPFKDALETLKHVEIIVVLRTCKASDKLRIAKQSQYVDYWKKLENLQAGVRVVVKFYPNNFLRAIIIDSSEGFLGFFEKKGDRLFGHSVPVIHARRGTPFEDHLLKVYLNRVSQMCEDGIDKPC